jgi:hypothetical protein
MCRVGQCILILSLQRVSSVWDRGLAACPDYGGRGSARVRRVGVWPKSMACSSGAARSRSTPRRGGAGDASICSKWAMSSGAANKSRTTRDGSLARATPAGSIRRSGGIRQCHVCACRIAPARLQIGPHRSGYADLFPTIRSGATCLGIGRSRVCQPTVTCSGRVDVVYRRSERYGIGLDPI